MEEILQDECEYPFSFIDQPSSLRYLALNELVLNLWRFKYYSRRPIERVKDTSASWFIETIGCDCEDIISLPPSMKQTIDDKIEEIGDQIYYWIYYHSIGQPTLFDGDFRDVFSYCFNKIVLNQQGLIAYKETASNLIQLDELSDDVKYKLACTYCLEDDVKRIWPSVSEDLRTVEDRYSLIYYWNCRMSSTPDPFQSITRFHSVYENWEALEYFFELLKDQQKISYAVAFLRRNNDYISLRLLRKLKRDLACEVFQSQACRILTILIKKEYTWHLLELWEVIKNVVVGNPIVFLNILNELWRCVFNGFSATSVGLDQVNDLLIEVWTNAPDELKSYVLDRHVDEFFDKLILAETKFKLYYGHDATFLLQLFINSCDEVRTKLWQKNWRKLVSRAKPFYLEQFLRSVFPNEEAIREFKRDSMSRFTPIFKSLCEYGLFSDLKNYLHFLTQDPKIILSLAKRALKSNVGAIVIGLQDSDNAREFNEFMGSIFFKSDEDVDKFKEQLISSNKSIENLCKSYNPRNLKNFNIAVNTLIASDQKLNEFKQRCLEFSRDYVMADQATDFSHRMWHGWLKWCTTNDSREYLAFKNSLSIDKILEKQITYFAKKFTHRNNDNLKNLHFFDEFGKWYFSSERTRKEFKLSKIKNFKKNKVIMDIFSARCEMKTSTLADWLFNSDYETTHGFLVTCGYYP